MATHNNPIIDRPVLDIVRRGRDGSKIPVILFIVAALFITFLAFGEKLKLPEFSLPQAVVQSPLDLEIFAVQSRTRSGLTEWTVQGKVINPTRLTETTPDLLVQLQREDGTVVAESVVDMQAQLLPARSALAFSAVLRTPAGERLSAVVNFAGKGRSAHE